MIQLLKHIARERRFHVLLVLGMLLMAAGCSTDYVAPTASNNNFDSKESNDLDGVPYPPLTEEMLADGPAPGYKFLQIPAAGRLDVLPCDSINQSRFIEEDENGTVSINHLVSVRITRGDLEHDARIRVIAPLACIAVADFYPHPYQFSGTVDITWVVKDMNLPPNFDYSRMIPWYVNDAGQYIPVNYEWRNGHDYLLVHTDHFSRYIISQAGG